MTALSALLLLTLAAPAPAARVFPQADAVLHIPRPDQLGEVTAFLTSAGQSSAMLHPDAWSRELLPGLALDVRDLEGLKVHGIDVTRPITSTFIDDGKITCVGVADPAVFERESLEVYKSYGAVWKDKKPGIFGTQVDGQPIYGLVMRKKEACIAERRGGVREQLLAAAKQLAKAPAKVAAFNGLEGAVWVLIPNQAAVALQADGTTLKANGVSLKAREPTLLGAGPSPYAHLRLSGVALARARLPKDASRLLARRMDSQLAAACPGCDRKQTGELVFALSKLLTGDVVVRVDRVQVAGSLQTAAARFFSVKQAMMAKLTDAEAAQALIARAKSWPHARETDRGVALSLTGGEVELGVSDGHLFFGNDAAAVTALVDNLPPNPAPLLHGAIIDVDPKLVHKAFGQVSLLDLMSSKELAAVVAVGTELGPLFGRSTKLTATADPHGGTKHRFALEWTLDAPNRR